MNERVIIFRSRYGHVVTTDPTLVEKARRAIRWRRDQNWQLEVAA